MEYAVLQRLKDFAKEKQLSVNAFSKAINMQQVTVNNQFRGVRSISFELILNVLDAFPELSAEWLIRGTGSMYKQEKTESEKDFEIVKLRAQVEILQDTLNQREHYQPAGFKKSV